MLKCLCSPLLCQEIFCSPLLTLACPCISKYLPVYFESLKNATLAKSLATNVCERESAFMCVCLINTTEIPALVRDAQAFLAFL